LLIKHIHHTKKAFGKLGPNFKPWLSYNSHQLLIVKTLDVNSWSKLGPNLKPPTSGNLIDHKLLIKRGRDSKSFLKVEDKKEIYAQLRVGLVIDKMFYHPREKNLVGKSDS